MMSKIDELVREWRARGPVSWAEGPYGWTDIDGQPVKLTDWQRAVLAGWWDHRETVTTLGISNVKKSGKTFTNAVLLCWRWLAMPGLHFAVANDLDQAAARQFDEIANMARRNAFLRQNVKFSGKTLEFLPTGAILAALAGDATGNAGANHLTVSHTEAWGITYEGDIRNWEELTPPPGKFYGLPPLRIADSYAGYLEESNTWHELVDRGLAGERLAGEWPVYLSGGLLLFHIDGQEAQRRCYRGSSQEAAVYYFDQRASLRENTYRRLHENERQVNVGTFIDQETWQALVSADHHPLPAGSKEPLYVGLDLAVAAGGDNCALIGVYFDEDKVKIGLHKVWQGGRLRLRKLSLSDTVEPFILGLARNYNLQGVYFDPWQAIHLAEHLRSAGINCVEVKQTHATRGPKDTALYEIATRGGLVLYNDQELSNMTAGASAKELGNGMIYLQKAGGRSKIDLLVALSNCADVCNATGQGWAGVTTLPNIFYEYDGADFSDFLQTPLGWEHLGEINRARHPPGVTWRTCRHRNKGCEACVREMTIEGEYQRQEEEAQARLAESAGVPMSEDEYYRQIRSITGHGLPKEVDHEYNKFQEAFWQRVRARKLARGAGGDRGHTGGAGQGG